MKKEARLKALWTVRLANQMSALPPFDQVFREFRRALRQSVSAVAVLTRRIEPQVPSGAKLAGSAPRRNLQ